jgi:hypothetical protein
MDGAARKKKEQGMTKNKQNLPPTPCKIKQAEREVIRARIFKAICGGTKTINTIAAKLGLPGQTVRYAIIGMRDRGEIIATKANNGYVHYTPPKPADPPPPEKYPGTMVLEKRNAEPIRTASTNKQHINQIRLPQFPWQNEATA